MRTRSFCRVWLSGVCLLGLIIAAPAQGLVIKVMPLGDSITYGTDGGYRGPLYQSLTSAGYSVNFVGTVNAGSIPDPDNEGHPGWTADMIRDNITNWLTLNPADVVLLHIGTNDISLGQSNSGIVSEVTQILDNIKAYGNAHNHSIVVILARIINRTDSKSAQTTAYNTALQSMADGRILNGDRLMVVNMEPALNYPGDLADVVHPNASGYGKMANVWYPALNSLFCSFAESVSDTIPTVMRRGGSYNCSITLKNSGCSWICYPVGTSLTVGQFTGPAVCKLIPYPFFNIYTNPCVVDITQNCTFPFTIDVPADTPAGQYQITWQMKDNNHWFGEFRDNQIFTKTVTVTCNQGDFVSDTIPTAMTAGSSYNCSVTMKNSGCQSWTCNAAGTRLTVGQTVGPVANKLIPAPYYQIYTNPCQIDVAQNCTFPFTINVPADTPGGVYQIDWQMKDNLELFDSNGHNAVFHKSVTVSALSPPTITAAISRKTHGGAGTFDIDVRAAGAVECRQSGSTLVVVTFNKPIQGVGGLSNDDVSLSSGAVSQLTINGSELQIQMSGATDAGLLTIGFPHIADASNAGAVVTGTLCFGVLLGDATGDKSANIFDLVDMRNHLNQPASAGYYRGDVNASGGMDIFDLVAARNNLNKSIGSSCP